MAWKKGDRVRYRRKSHPIISYLERGVVSRDEVVGALVRVRFESAGSRSVDAEDIKEDDSDDSG
jgi:hypothetical protein